MHLGDLGRGWLEVPSRHARVEVLDLTCDSRRVVSGALFVAVPGTTTDGAIYAREAVHAGAVAVLSARDGSNRTLLDGVAVPVLRVPDVRQALGRAARAFFGDASRRIAVTGVTGTKGKTTTTWLLDSILRAAGKTTALFGTVENRIGPRRFAATNTTPACLDLHRWLAELAKEGGTHATLEVSSHALEQERTAGIEFRVAVLTNIAPEHLDYHRTMDAYFAAKRKLFQGLGPAAVAILPREEPRGQAIASRTRAQVLWYGADPQDGVTALRADRDGVEFVWKGLTVRAKLWGHHNLENLLAAMAAAECCGLEAAEIAAAVATVRLPPGRLEEIDYPAPFRVIVDYAHTDGSLEAVLRALRPITRGRLITVFGCGGNRDATKRPRMGRAAECGSDHVIVTSDNPRKEVPDRILDEIVKGLERPQEAAVVVDRREAIALGIRMAREGDTVLIAGKGHETYQELMDGRIHFDDREVALQFMKETLEGCPA